MFVVTLPASAKNNPGKFSRLARQAGADILEIRGDLAPDIRPFNSLLPVLLSPRGNSYHLINQLDYDYIDLELNEIDQINYDPKKLIISHHDYDQTPPLNDLKKIADEMLKNKPEIIKIATFVNYYQDLKTLDELHKIIPANQKRIILGMGPKAHLNRMLSPLKNELTYTCIDKEDEGAPGQVDLQMYKLIENVTLSRPAGRSSIRPPLRSGLLRVTQLAVSKGDIPAIFGLLGSPDIQSLSPLIHNTLFNKHKINAIYSLFLSENLDDAWDHIITLGTQGFSVTAPFKQEIINKLDDLSEDARLLGTVNTIIKKDNKWIGYPRDAQGLINGYPFLKGAKSAAILGSGGVVSSVIYACQLSGIKDITVFARNKNARSQLASKFNIKSAPLEDLSKNHFNVIICSISAEIDPPLPAPKNNSSAIDLRYGKKTKFLKKASELGYKTYNGLPMLLHQALAQFELFSGIKSSASDLDLILNLLKPYIVLQRRD